MFDKLHLAQVSRKVEGLREVFKDTKVRPGWIRYMREALGMKVKDLARLTDLSSNTITETEKREAEGKVTIQNLRKMAHAMDCELVYAFLPKEEIGELLESKAYEKARKAIMSADTHMTLEDQKVSSDTEERIQRLAQKLIEKGDVW
jgi:predicted DNA-binding mobile mystery protein A